jgi:hypothetical protein
MDAGPVDAGSIDAGNVVDAGPVDAGCGLPLSTTDHQTRVQWIEQSLITSISSFERSWIDGGQLQCPAPSGGGTVHDFGDYALSKVVLGDAGLAAPGLDTSAVSCLFTFQDEQPDSGTYGVFRFHFGDPYKPSDNPTEFALLPVAALAATQPTWASNLNAYTSQLMAGLSAIEAHPVCPAYTNICLMQTAEMLALGGVLANNTDLTVRQFGLDRINSGRQRLSNWLAFTADAGITEFDTPTYTEVDLEVLGLAYLAAPDAATRAQVVTGLDDFWSDISANTFAPRGSLSGPNSRSYDFFTAQGGISLSMYLAGIRTDQPSQGADLSKGLLLLDWADGGYAPQANPLCMSTWPIREVRSTYGLDAGVTHRQRYVYITPDYTLGSASADYGTSLSSDQDQLIQGQLPSTWSAQVMSILPDYLDAPGQPEQAGDFTKVTHLQMSPASVQQGGALLVLLRIPAQNPRYTNTDDGGVLPLVNLATNVIIPVPNPADAGEIWLDAHQVGAQSDVVLGPTPTMVIRLSHGALAASVLEASGRECVVDGGGIVEDTTPSLEFKPLPNEGHGYGPGARLAIYHDMTPPQAVHALDGCFARVALFMVGSACDGGTCAADFASAVGAANASSTHQFDGGDWSVTVQAPGGPTLYVHRRVGTSEQIFAREVNGQEVQYPPLEVNGVSIPLAP